MSFFGYAVSDATQSWLLYQGVLFVLVMMFLPSGLSGLSLKGRSATTVLLTAAAGLLLAAGGVFTIELLQRLCSQDYRALAAAATEWPAVSMFGRSWLPGVALTWIVPVVLLSAGAVLLLVQRRKEVQA
jgi:branched-chain amino acid transport system permease protein